MTIKEIAQQQRDYFLTGSTLDYQFRSQQLARLEKIIRENENQLLKALKNDLGKSEAQAYSSEIGIFYKEIKEAQKNLFAWMKPRKTSDGLISFPSHNTVHSCPYGTSLIISPWNYPFQLAFNPLVGSMAAGNCSVIKPSEFTPHTSELIAKILNENFEGQYLQVVLGAIDETQELLAQNFDKIFFTGSTQVGKIVMKAAAENLSSVTLELGGKSPCIVDKDCNLEVSLRRILWGKFINCGQTCVAPDYLVVHCKFKNKLKEQSQKILEQFYGKNPQESEDYGRIVSQRHLERLLQLIQASDAMDQCQYDKEDRYLAPFILENCQWNHPLMQEEIFGPILPVLYFDDLNEVLNQIKRLPTPLAFYYFGQNSKAQQTVIEQIPFGGGCINDTILHLSHSELPFGGVKESGMGRYHGKYSFEAFSYQKSVMKRNYFLDHSLRYPPLAGKLKWLRKILN